MAGWLFRCRAINKLQSMPCMIECMRKNSLCQPKGGESVGRAKKQKHGPAITDGKGRAGSSADDSMIPRQAITSAIRHGMATKGKGK